MATKKPNPKQNVQDLSSDQPSNDHHIVVATEFDGKQPNGTYYDRLHALGIYVHSGNRDEFESPLARRNSGNHKAKAVVFQEGMFLCANMDVAKTIADIADEAGAAAVWIGTMQLREFRLTTEDVRVLEQYKKVVGRRGPKPAAEKGRYLITCYAEAASFEADLDSIPANCPSCGSFHFQARIGKQRSYAKPYWDDQEDVWNYWCKTRFGKEGTFEIPSDKAGKLAPPQSMNNAPEHFDLRLPDNFTPASSDMLKMWDAAYCLGRFNKLERNEMRLMILNGYIMTGGKNQYQMFSSMDMDGSIDLPDLCILLPEFRELL